MKTVAVNVPDALLLNTSDEDLARQSQFLLALKFFELGRLTSSQAAEMCGMNRVDFLVAASQTGTCVADLNEEELRREIHDATSLYDAATARIQAAVVRAITKEG